MNESMPPPPPDLQTGPRMSLGGRLTNVFAAPAEVFDEVKKSTPSNANWLVPALLLCLVGIVATFVIFSQDSILQQIREQQDRAMEKKLEKVPKEQREQIREIVDKVETAVGKEAEALRPKLKAAEDKLRELKQAGTEAWGDLKPGLGKAWDELSKSLNQAATRFKSRPK